MSPTPRRHKRSPAKDAVRGSETTLDPRRASLTVPWIMGVINVTPDSFYAASRSRPESAVDRALRLVEEGADILDIGGESTRPGAESVTADEESRRVVPVIAELAARVRVPLSVDTSKAAVARRAFEAGATILNDVSALRGDEEMPAAALEFSTVVLMHMLGIPKTMQESPRYDDIVADIIRFFEDRIEAFERVGGDAGRVWLDPGIGFGKTLEHNLEIFRRMESFKALGRPLLIGASRKSFIGRILGSEESPVPPEERLEGSIAAACRAAAAGANVVRVHDVLATRRALAVFAASTPAPEPGRSMTVKDASGRGTTRR
ncbi:MAG: dihydropteroate synthase [Elusimicrobia bacterium]|nr:dihydropteroate synthase [Elusimicrobiota bacterium]